jgi:hypothetical protein
MNGVVNANATNNTNLNNASQTSQGIVNTGAANATNQVNAGAANATSQVWNATNQANQNLAGGLVAQQQQRGDDQLSGIAGIYWGPV